jgi:hypothetical protein
MRESFEEGVSVEAEYAFTKAVGGYCKEAVREGSFKGNYVFNLKEQMGKRMGAMASDGGKVRVAMVGGSQMGRLAKEMEKKGKDVLEGVQWVKVSGRLDKEAVGGVFQEVMKMGKKPEKIVVGGPANSLFRHGVGANAGFCPERTVTVEKGKDGGVKGMSVRYHMTEPTRLTMKERRELVDRTVDLMTGLQELAPEAELWYATMFPRYVSVCCDKKDHMKDEDRWAISGVRKGVDTDVTEELERAGVKVVEWWELLGWNDEENVDVVRDKGVVGIDGVHLTVAANSIAAVSLCRRIVDVELMSENGATKRQRKE